MVNRLLDTSQDEPTPAKLLKTQKGAMAATFQDGGKPPPSTNVQSDRNETTEAFPAQDRMNVAEFAGQQTMETPDYNSPQYQQQQPGVTANQAQYRPRMPGNPQSYQQRYMSGPGVQPHQGPTPTLNQLLQNNAIQQGGARFGGQSAPMSSTPPQGQPSGYPDQAQVYAAAHKEGQAQMLPQGYRGDYAITSITPESALR